MRDGIAFVVDVAWCVPLSRYYTILSLDWQAISG